MRKITEEAVNALMNGDSFKSGNTEVTHTLDGAKMWLHDNLIAVLNGAEVTLYNQGWTINTTKERLNGIISPYGFIISQKAGKWYLNGDEWSEGVTINLDTKEVTK